MATKKFIIEVEEGSTLCANCPFDAERCHRVGDDIPCETHNLATMKITEYNEGEALLYAVNKTAERTKREMIEKAAEWLSNNMFHSINNGVQINGTCVSDFIERFKQAMQDESK